MLFDLCVHLQHKWLHLQCSFVIFVLESQLANSIWISGVVLTVLINSLLLCSHCLHSLFSFSIFFSLYFYSLDLLIRQEVVWSLRKSVEAWSVENFNPMIVIKSTDVLRVFSVLQLQIAKPLGRSECAWNQSVRFDWLNQLRNWSVLFYVLL